MKGTAETPSAAGAGGATASAGRDRRVLRRVVLGAVALAVVFLPVCAVALAWTSLPVKSDRNEFMRILRLVRENNRKVFSQK